MVRNFIRDQLGNSALYIFDDISHLFLILRTLRIYDYKLCYILQLFFYFSLQHPLIAFDALFVLFHVHLFSSAILSLVIALLLHLFHFSLDLFKFLLQFFYYVLITFFKIFLPLDFHFFLFYLILCLLPEIIVFLYLCFQIVYDNILLFFYFYQFFLICCPLPRLFFLHLSDFFIALVYFLLTNDQFLLQIFLLFLQLINPGLVVLAHTVILIVILFFQLLYIYFMLH